MALVLASRVREALSLIKKSNEPKAANALGQLNFPRLVSEFVHEFQEQPATLQLDGSSSYLIGAMGMVKLTIARVSKLSTVDQELSSAMLTVLRSLRLLSPTVPWSLMEAMARSHGLNSAMLRRAVDELQDKDGLLEVAWSEVSTHATQVGAQANHV